MSDITKPAGAQEKSGLRIPGFAQLQRLGKSLMLPIAVLPAAGILLRLGQPDLLGRIESPVIGDFFKAMSAAGDALFSNLALLFAVGVAIGFARKADGSTALSAVVGYLVMEAVFKTMSPIVLAGELDKAGEQAQINYSVFAGIVIGLVTAWLFDRYHTIQLPSYLGFFGGRRFVPIVVSLASLFIAFAMSYLYPFFDAGLTSLGEFIGGAGALGAFVYGFANRMLIPLGLHHIPNSYVWFLYGDYQPPGGEAVTGELTRFAAGDPTAGILTSGFYPILMFGLPAAALAMIHVANKKQRKVAVGILSAAALTAFVTGITEPLEFAFMFVAFPLYVIHALLTGLSLAIAYLLDIHLGFSFSAGLIDLLLYLLGAGSEEHSAADRHGCRVLRRVLRVVPVRDHEVEHAHTGTGARKRVRGRGAGQPRRGCRFGDRRDGRRRDRDADRTHPRGQQGRAGHHRVRRTGEPRQRRRLHHAATRGSVRQGQGGSGPPEEPRRRGRRRGRQQRSGGLRHRCRGVEERHQRDPLRALAAECEATASLSRSFRNTFTLDDAMATQLVASRKAPTSDDRISSA